MRIWVTPASPISPFVEKTSHEEGIKCFRHNQTGVLQSLSEDRIWSAKIISSELAPFCGSTKHFHQQEFGGQKVKNQIHESPPLSSSICNQTGKGYFGIRLKRPHLGFWGTFSPKFFQIDLMFEENQHAGRQMVGQMNMTRP